MANKNKKIYNEYMKHYMLKRYHERRDFAIGRLGGKCVRCGSKKYLQLDHIDAKTKLFSISKLWSINLSKYINEVDKCQLLCFNCHIIKSIENDDFIKHHFL